MESGLVLGHRLLSSTLLLVGKWDDSNAGWDGHAGSCGFPGMSFVDKVVFPNICC